jgi:1-aminocyclopropane-1-carboxylate deaminase/D-cysteine desulfhydrase-like pyridoxal-dependent ACC family enzyme
VQPPPSDVFDIIDSAAVQRRLAELPPLQLAHYPTPVEEMTRLRTALGGGPRLLVKRDDALSFGGGGNKVRKVEMLAAGAVGEGADTLISTGGVQSNHARVVAAMAARLGMHCVLVVNGPPPSAPPTGNARLMSLFGARIDYVESRAARQARMHEIAEQLRDQGRRPYILPLGASTALGALGFVRAAGELLSQIDPPDVIVLASSSGGTQAGLASGCALFAPATRVIGVSADDAEDEVVGLVRGLMTGVSALLGLDHRPRPDPAPVHVDAGFVGDGYAIPTRASAEAARLAAATEGLVLDPTYTAKSMAALIAYVREGRFSDEHTVLFWHTGGVPGFFA